MTLVALCSGKGAPGVSTLACVVGAVWPPKRRVVVAECDPSGNDLVARFGLSPRHGMTSLALSQRRSERSDATFDLHLQSLPGGLEVLVGPVTPDAASSLDREFASVGTAMFPPEIDLLVDCGRVLSSAPGQQEIVKAADHVIVVSRPDAAGLAHALWTLDLVRNVSEGVSSIVVVGSLQFSVGEMESAFRTKLVGAIPRDEKSAAMVCGTPGRSRRFARSDLVISARRLVDQILSQRGLGHEVLNNSDLDGVDRSGCLRGDPAWTVQAHQMVTPVEQGAKT